MSNQYNLEKFKELLTTTLREKPNSYVVEELFRQFPTLKMLITATEEDLLNIKGIGPKKARQIASALHLARMNNLPDEQLPVIKSPQDVFNLLSRLQFLDREHFIVLGLNTKNQVVFEETISIGSLNSSIVHPRECFKPLIRFSCAATILAHNHPSGDPTPSSEDLSVTKRLTEAGTILGIEILDHVIVGQNKYVSLKEQGYI